MNHKNEITPKAERRTKEYESGEKPSRVLRSHRNKSFQSLNYTFVEDVKKGSYLGPVNNIRNSCKHTLIKEILSYASTAPRPILTSEAEKAVVYEVSVKGAEFHILHNLLSQNFKELVRATKTYTQVLVHRLPKITDSIGFLSNSLNHSKIRVLFLSGPREMLWSVCAEGWKSVGQTEGVRLRRVIEDGQGVEEQKSVIVCLAARESIKKVEDGVYEVLDYSAVVPVYLLVYC